MTKLLSTGFILFNYPGSDQQFNQLFNSLLIIMIGAALLCFLVSEITRNYSQVDKLWSIMPAVYALVTLAAYPSPRLALMSLLVVAWALRLSINFGRKGGYNIVPWKGEEDYRWKIMQEHPLLDGPLRFALFNLLFISLYQHLLIFLFTTPLLIAVKYGSTPIGPLDYVAALLMITFLVTETIADNQQFRFHKLKKMENPPAGIYEKSLQQGFLSEGLWGLVRHPNFTSEQAIWISFYLFGVSASGQWLNWTVAGALLLVLLFIGSTSLTEKITGGKYPAYAIYKESVPRALPRLTRKRDENS